MQNCKIQSDLEIGRKNALAKDFKWLINLLVKFSSMY